MNKKGSFGFILFLGVFILLIVAIGIGAYMEHRNFQDFCQDNGFESYETGAWRGIDHICIKVEDGYRVEKQFDNCGRIYCFIKDDDAKVEVDE